MARTVAILALYAFAFAFIWAGVDAAPAQGWPSTSSETNGCAFLILGMIAKTAGHFAMMNATRR